MFAPKRSKLTLYDKFALAIDKGYSLPGKVDTLLTFREFVTKVQPRYRWYRHCCILADVLQDVADGKRKRVMIFMPPRHGKSEETSRLFSAYWLYRFAHQWVGISSYGSDLALTLSRSARDNFVKGGGSVKADSSAVKHWETTENGGMWAAGVGGPITGKGMHLGIIDDPLKNDEEARSSVIREKQKEWYKSTFYTREEPAATGEVGTESTSSDAAIIVIQTRWHGDDLSGWLLSQELSDEDNPERWHVVCMPAIATCEVPDYIPSTCTVEPEFRQVGEALCPERRPLPKLIKTKAIVGNYHFSALFQQSPTVEDGEFFTTFPIIDAIPPGSICCRGWDKAGSQGKGDWTAGVKIAETPNGTYVVCDVVRGRWASDDREKAIRDTATKDGVDTWIMVEQEGGSGGKDSASITIRGLAGFVAYAQSVTGDKASRARPLSAQALSGNVSLLRGDWNAAFEREAKEFPNGTHDDQIDAASLAFNKLALMPRPVQGVAVPSGPSPAVPYADAMPGGIPLVGMMR